MARQNNDESGNRILNLVGGKTFAVSIPLEIIKILGWQKGQKLVVRRRGRQIIIEERD